MSNSLGAIARFVGPDELMTAIGRLRGMGFTELEAYSPFPIHGIDKALGRSRSKLAWVVLAGGLLGAGLGYFVQWYLSVVEYPIIVGGKPLDSREAWVPITFEITILFSAFAAIGGMFAFNKLPRLHHPVFDAPEFASATNDGFFLTVSGNDAKFDPQSTLRFLLDSGGHDVTILDLED